MKNKKHKVINKNPTQPVDIEFSPETQKFIKLQSGQQSFYTNMPEVRFLKNVLSPLSPNIVVDIGSGIGRASVYFFKRFGWDQTKFILFDGDSGDYTYYGPNRTDLNEFYNNQHVAETFCYDNGLMNLQFINAEQNTLNDLPNNVDIFYSFLAFGFHWSIEHIIDHVWEKLNEGGLFIIGTPGQDKPKGNDFAAEQWKLIDKTKWKIVLNTRRPHLERSSVLVLEKITAS